MFYRETAQCETCKRTYLKVEMLENKKNKCYCVDCFKKRYNKSSGDHGDKPDIRDKMIPYPEIYYKRKQAALMSKMGAASTTSLSKKPLQCPKADCNKFISIFTLETHFRYEHKEVPIILTQLDARSALEFYPRDIRYGILHCVALINVINHDFSSIMPQTSTYCSQTNFQTTNYKPVMVLLATRISACQLKRLASECEVAKTIVEDKEDEVSVVTATDTTLVSTKQDFMSPVDKIIVWVAANIATNLSYTVAVSTLSMNVRQKYFGPMGTLGEDPLQLCKDGDCLTLMHFHINTMSECGLKPLALDIVIHNSE